MASHFTDDDFIDMEIISSSSSNSFFPYSSSIKSPPHSSSTKEFEFQMSSVPDQEEEALTFPADELFYKGKLLPLHLPPRLKMVQNILQTTQKFEQEEEETFTIPFNLISRTSTSSTAPCTNSNTPLDQSCNISPSESCRVSCELNPDEFLSQWSTEVRVFIGGTASKKYSSSSSWSAKLMKQFSLGRKLKASRAYLKSLFNKSSCNVSDNINIGSKNIKSKCNTYAEERISTTLMKSIEKEILAEAASAAGGGYRKSFSGVIQRHVSSSSGVSANNKLSLSSCSISSGTTSASSSVSSSSSSSFSLSSSNGCSNYDHLQLFKRSSSASSELESSIEGAIAHCKQSSSQQFCSSRKSTSQDHGASFSLSRIAV
ncbi:hypothetical protein TIFTF001_008278 [Ficus carica]|uniref:Membrane-associated kinase regulator 4 n=1 Tax=Ficus carica TaxID=3494 RepID=A0AA87ZT14_FICCA|nr:hypothetical protein TIFTF001_008278 [Ficus carica]